MTEKRHPPIWERQPCDTSESWPCFKIYRDAKGTRRLERIRYACPGLAQPMADLYRWYVEHNWADRVKAYDLHMDGILQEEKDAIMRQSARDLAASHMALVQDAEELASNELGKLLQASRESAAAGLLKPGDLIKLIDAAVKLGRLVKGESTENVQVSGDLENLTESELEAYLALAKKAEGEH